MGPAHLNFFHKLVLTRAMSGPIFGTCCALRYKFKRQFSRNFNNGTLVSGIYFKMNGRAPLFSIYLSRRRLSCGLFLCCLSADVWNFSSARCLIEKICQAEFSSLFAYAFLVLLRLICYTSAKKWVQYSQSNLRNYTSSEKEKLTEQRESYEAARKGFFYLRDTLGT